MRRLLNNNTNPATIQLAELNAEIHQPVDFVTANQVAGLEREVYRACCFINGLPLARVDVTRQSWMCAMPSSTPCALIIPEIQGAQRDTELPRAARGAGGWGSGDELVLSVVPNFRSPRSTPPPHLTNCASRRSTPPRHLTNLPSPRSTPPPQVGVDLNEMQQKVMDNRRLLKGWDATAAFQLMERYDEWLPSLHAHQKYKLLVYWAHERRYQNAIIEEGFAVRYV